MLGRSGVSRLVERSVDATECAWGGDSISSAVIRNKIVLQTIILGLKRAKFGENYREFII